MLTLLNSTAISSPSEKITARSCATHEVPIIVFTSLIICILRLILLLGVETNQEIGLFVRIEGTRYHHIFPGSHAVAATNLCRELISLNYSTCTVLIKVYFLHLSPLSSYGFVKPEIMRKFHFNISVSKLTETHRV